ncbi:multicopper oxidase domain-containing protein [Streptomyces nojiriensis]|uniref:multicopper oxidase domain-containing protein n=1 Tax=Streptomyces nojiriensis TaxID=66374 RepID=UPI003695A096
MMTQPTTAHSSPVRGGSHDQPSVVLPSRHWRGSPAYAARSTRKPGAGLHRAGSFTCERESDRTVRPTGVPPARELRGHGPSGPVRGGGGNALPAAGEGRVHRLHQSDRCTRTRHPGPLPAHRHGPGRPVPGRHAQQRPEPRCPPSARWNSATPSRCRPSPRPPWTRTGPASSTCGCRRGRPSSPPGPGPRPGVSTAVTGPTLRAAKGEKVRVRVANTLPEESTVHWHGMHLPAAMDGGPHQMVPAGGSWAPDSPRRHPHPARRMIDRTPPSPASARVRGGSGGAGRALSRGRGTSPHRAGRR